MLIQIIHPDFEFKDERGTLVQLVREGFQQFNIIYSKKGVLRRNHYHKENKEAFYIISGQLELQVEWNGTKENYQFKTGDMFLIPPFVVHSFYYIENTYLASMYNIGVEKEDNRKDIFII